MIVNGILCDKATNHPDTGTDVIGCFTGIIAKEFPIHPGITALCHVCFEHEEAVGEYKFDLRMKLPDGSVTDPILWRSIGFRSQPRGRVVQELQFPATKNLLIGMAGEFELQIWHGEDCLCRLPFAVLTPPD